jgi:putative ABC transport system permease protein
MQFVGETVLFSLLALAFSYVLLQFLKTGYLQLPLNQEFAMTLQEDWLVYSFFLLFAVAVGMFAGLLPAGYLSAFKPVSVLKDTANLKVYSKLTFRKVLMVAQFTFSVFFVIIVLIIYRQINFMLNADYGITQTDILNVRLQGVPFQKMANEIKGVPGVINVGGVSHALGTWSDLASDYKKNIEDKPFVMRDFRVNDIYIDNLEMQFLAGKNFDPSEQGENEKHVVLNETALSYFQFANPIDAIGESIYVSDSTMLTVVGVVKDFNFRPLSYQIGPLALRYQINELSYASIKIAPGQKDAVIAAIQPIWKKLDSVHPIEYKMMDEQIDEAYSQAGFDSILLIVGYITFLTVSLACLGMLGMAMYATQVRVKEVGVRKVLGASVTQVVFLLSKSFMYLIGAAIVIGTPLSIYLGDLLMSNYAYQAGITVWLVLSGIAIVAGLGLIIISSQTWYTAAANPVKSLKYE